MGRAEKRKEEHRNAIEKRKGKLLVSHSDLSELKRQERDRISRYDVEALMSCFALAEHRLYSFGHKRIMRSLQYIDQLMNAIVEDKAVMEDYLKELEDETGIIVKCGN